MELMWRWWERCQHSELLLLILMLLEQSLWETLVIFQLCSIGINLQITRKTILNSSQYLHRKELYLLMKIKLLRLSSIQKNLITPYLLNTFYVSLMSLILLLIYPYMEEVLNVLLILSLKRRLRPKSECQQHLK